MARLKSWLEPALLLILACAVLTFANGERTAAAAAAWIGPVLLVRFLRRQPFWRGLLLAFLAGLPVWLLQWSGVFRLHGAELLVTAAVLSLIGLVPYALDRWLAPRLGQWGVLVLPSALVGLEFGFTLVSDYGSWGSLAYSQVNLLPLVQAASLVGMWAMTFLIGWAASTANLVWQAPGEPRRWTAAVGAFVVVLAALAGFGLNRLGAPAPKSPVIKAASVAAQYDNNRNYDLSLAPAIEDHLFAQSEQAARAGAQLVVWPEDSFFLPAADEPALIARGQQLARRLGLRLGMSYGVTDLRSSPYYRNTSVLIGPDGGLLWRYDKRYAVPGHEARYMAPGRYLNPFVDTSWGRIGGAICFDGDHHDVISRFGEQKAALAILPSDDWPAVVDLHARMVRMRAVEQGVPILRPTMNGRSLALDAHGRILASLGPDAANPKVMSVAIPLGAIPTLYARIGDAFAWACLGALGLLAIVGLTRRRPA